VLLTIEQLLRRLCGILLFQTVMIALIKETQVVPAIFIQKVIIRTTPVLSSKPQHCINYFIGKL